MVCELLPDPCLGARFNFTTFCPVCQGFIEPPGDFLHLGREILGDFEGLDNDFVGDHFFSSFLHGRFFSSGAHFGQFRRTTPRSVAVP